MKTGFIVGKFAPLTTGHVNFINRSSTKCDKLLVLLSYDENWRKKQTPSMAEKLNLSNRLKWLKETYCDIDHIIIDYVDESLIPDYPDGWAQYTELVEEVSTDTEETSVNICVCIYDRDLVDTLDLYL